MAEVSWRGLIVNTEGDLPQVGSKAPDFMLAAQDLSDVSLGDFTGKNLILNIFPSIDTPTCATSVRTFNVKAANQDNTVVLCVSVDLPQAQAAFAVQKTLRMYKRAQPSVPQILGQIMESMSKIVFGVACLLEPSW